MIERGQKETDMSRLAALVAQMSAAERPFRFLPHGGKLFCLRSGWEAEVVRAEKGVAYADTLLSFEAALRDHEILSIFVPKDALMAESDIEKLCRRNGVGKNIFREEAGE